MKKQERILVVGASGTVGTELTRILREKGYELRLTTSRKPISADQVQVNLATGQGVEAAFEGVDRAFFLSPPGYADQYATLAPLIRVAKEKKLKKVVLMTAMGANAVETAPFRKAELDLERSGLAYSILRPNWFMQNFNTFWIEGILKANQIALPAGSAAVSLIDARDIAAAAAETLTRSEFDGKDFDLTGPASITHAAVAAEISKVSGREVSYSDVAPEVLKQGLLGAGLPGDYVDFLILIFGFLKEGYSARVTDSVKRLTGHEPRSISVYAADYKAAWK